MIRKAISCDICGTEMINANHWFVARESGTELRISIWNGQNQIRGSCRHLCGHKCLHKLLDDFTGRVSQLGTASSEKAAPGRSHNSSTERPPVQPSRLPVISSIAPEPDMTAPRLVGPQTFLERPSHHQLCADAWKRERDRQQRNADQRSIA